MTASIIRADYEGLTNRRLALNYSDALPEECEVKFLIHDSAGVELPFTSRVNIGHPEDRHFAELGPGQQLEREYPLGRTYPLTAPGRYTVQALYQNATDPSTGPAWKGELRSNSVAFEVTPPAV